MMGMFTKVILKIFNQYEIIFHHFHVYGIGRT